VRNWRDKKKGDTKDKHKGKKTESKVTPGGAWTLCTGWWSERGEKSQEKGKLSESETEVLGQARL